MSTRVLTVAVQAEHDLVLVRQRTRQLAQQLGLDQRQQTRLATAVSEITRNAFQYAGHGEVEFLVERSPVPKMLVRVQDSGPGIAKLEEIMEGQYRSLTGLGLGLAGARRLVDHFEIETNEETGTTVHLGVHLPDNVIENGALLEHIETLTRTSPGNPFGEVLQQNQELLRAQNELAIANQELEAAQAAKDRFLAMLAHELRNLLNALRSSMEVLKRRPEEEVRDRMEQVADLQVEHLGRLVDDLLDASRIVRGTLELQRQPVDLAAETRSVVSAWNEQIVRSGIQMTVEALSEPLWISADPTRLAQVMGNLISNASKFTDPRGRILVEVRKEAETAMIRVTDDGCGLTPDGLQKVFEPFAQAAEARRRMTGGLGLGLAIVKGLVEAHGGTIEATSQGLGTGLTVSLQFPLEERAPISEDSPCASSSIPQDGLRLLLVDDHEPTIISLAELLRLDGHDVCTATDGPTALQEALNFQPEIVLCDLGLPEMDGNEVARRLKQQSNKIRLIAVSGFVDKQSRENALKAGFDYVLPKPVDFERLSALLSNDPREI